MSSPARPGLLRRLMGIANPAPEFDPADMGTAIGLDFMLDQAPLPGEAPHHALHGTVIADTSDCMVRHWAN